MIDMKQLGDIATLRFLGSLEVYPFKNSRSRVKFQLLFRMIVFSKLKLETIALCKRTDIRKIGDTYHLGDTVFTKIQIGGYYERCLAQTDCIRFLFCNHDGESSQNTRYAIEFVNKIYDFAEIKARGIKPISGKFHDRDRGRRR